MQSSRILSVVDIMKLFIVIFLLFSDILTGRPTKTALPPPTQDIFLARISGDYNQRTYDLILEVNHKGFIKAIKTRSNKKNKIKRYSLEVFNKPIPLVKTAGIMLVSLKCLNFSISKGCDIHIEYPSNLSVGKFKHFKSKLTQVKGKWRLYSDNKVFTKMHIISKTFLGLPIGVRQIKLSLLQNNKSQQ